MSELADEKLALEVAALRQEQRHAIWKLVLSVLGALLVFAGLVIDRVNVAQQRAHEFNVLRLEKKTQRMTTIAAEFDAIYSQTADVLYRNRSRTWLLVTNVGMIHQALRDLRTNDPNINDLRRYIDDAYDKLAKSKATVDEWSDGIALEAKWEGLRYSPTPDFAVFYGDDLLAEWRHVVELAVIALKAEYSLSGTHPTEKLDEFMRVGATFQKKLHEQINAIQVVEE